MEKQDAYGLGIEAPRQRREPPRLPYEPPKPSRYRPKIGVIGCGGIAGWHLKAYRSAGYPVVALCDIDRNAATRRQSEFFPEADVHVDFRQLLDRGDIDIVDIALHPEARHPIMEAAIRARKHVLSQKPFVLDLDEGERLAALAEEHGVKLAINQNGRWAPHFSYIREAVRQGYLGEIMAAHFSVHWNHDWLSGTSFNEQRHVLLYDFAIHWFDIARIFFNGKQATSVTATAAPAPGQKSRPPLLAQAMMTFEGGHASLALDAATKFGPLDRTYVAGTKGSAISEGRDLTKQKVTIFTADGFGSPRLKGRWFPSGFQGAMGELLRSIEENCEPAHSARDNLDSLALCFAAVASAEEGRTVTPGTVRRLPLSTAGF